jgi:hypothetical protein
MHYKQGFKSWMTWAYFAIAAWLIYSFAITDGRNSPAAVLLVSAAAWFAQYCWWHVWQVVKRLAQKAIA